MLLLSMLLLLGQSHTLLQPSMLLKPRRLNKSSFLELDFQSSRQRIIYDKDRDVFVRTVVFPSKSDFEESFEAFIRSGTFASPYKAFQNGSRSHNQFPSSPFYPAPSSHFIVMPPSIFQPITESFIAEMNRFFTNMGQNMGTAMTASMPANFAYAAPANFNNFRGDRNEAPAQTYYPPPSSSNKKVEPSYSSPNVPQKAQTSQPMKTQAPSNVPVSSNASSGDQNNFQSISAVSTPSSSGAATIGSASSSTSSGSSSASILKGKDSNGNKVLLGSTTANENKLVAILPTNVTTEPTGLIISSKSKNEASNYVKDPSFIDTLGKSVVQDSSWEEEQVKKSFHGLVDHIDLENAEVFVEGKDTVAIQILKPVRGKNLEDLIKLNTTS